MIVTSAWNRHRRNTNDGFSTKAVALKLFLSAATVGAFINMWLFYSYYSEDEDIHNLTHHDAYDDSDKNGWGRANEIAIRDEWDHHPTEDGWEAKESAISGEWEPILRNKYTTLVNEEAVEDEKTATDYEPNKVGKATIEEDEKAKEELAPFISTKSCFKARSNTIPEHLYGGKLQKPYFNLGFPKMGTSSLHNFFDCGGIHSVHYRCNRVDSCARCMRESVEAGGRPLDLCEMGSAKIDMYAQMDDGVYFPQIELLDELVAGYPNATLFITFRSIEKWYNSLNKWPPRRNGPHMNDKLKKEDINGFPSGVGKNIDEFADWFCNHVERVRGIVANSPKLQLVEVDIEDSTIAKRMSDMFDIDESCWGHTNVNPMSNPGMDLSEVKVSKKYKEFANKKSHD